MPRTTKSNTNGGNPVSILDLSKAIAPTVTRTKRESCHDYQGAYEYFCERVAEQSHNKDAKDTWVRTGPKGTYLEGKTYIEIRLHSMPLFWRMEAFKDGSGKEVEDTIYNPDGSERTKRKRMIGYSRYEVSSIDEGWKILNGLAAEEDPVFKEILTRAAAALKEVDEIENPHINEMAEQIYNDTAAWVKDYGKWEEQDVKDAKGIPKSFSKDKTNKKNNAKQKARAKLGYTRAKVVVDAD